MTNDEIANKLGNKIAPRTVSSYTLGVDPPFKVKKFADREPGELTEQWKEEGRKLPTSAPPPLPASNHIGNSINWHLERTC